MWKHQAQEAYPMASPGLSALSKHSIVNFLSMCRQAGTFITPISKALGIHTSCHHWKQQPEHCVWTYEHHLQCCVSNKVADPGSVFPKLLTDKLSGKDVLQKAFTMALGITGIMSISAFHIRLAFKNTISHPFPPAPSKQLGVAGPWWVLCSTTSSRKGSLRPTQPHHNGVLNFQTS